LDPSRSLSSGRPEAGPGGWGDESGVIQAEPK
jgi:hypothetical protein